MKSISILLPDLRGGGAEHVNLDLAYEFKRLGCEVEFVLKQARGELLEEARAGFSIVDLDTPRVRALPLPLIRYLRQARPDALLAAMWPLTTIAAVTARMAGRGIRVLVSEHGVLSSQYSGHGRMHRAAMRLSTALGYRLASARIGVSHGVAQDMRRLAFLREGEVQFIHNPVRDRGCDSITDTVPAESFWGKRKGKRIVTVGRLKAVKNHALLLRGFARLLESTPATLMLVGAGELEEHLRHLANDLGVAEQVVFAGFHDDPAPFYASADLFVLTSDREGFGNVIVEAMAQGTPVVCTDCPFGPAEILEGGRFGRLVPVGDEVALAEAMGDVLVNPPDSANLRRRAAEFAPDIAARKYLELLFPT
ncbi:glycosyltransferase [Wenzhouxiangella marina]|nr:glycosyltransferase [Wenzhouxiangella marina]MBB6087568.1 glycosyltransferase involved in cell wall biosynthesis [Wenzhouxiangella marina]